MWIGYWSERRIAHRSDVDVTNGFRGDRNCIFSSQLHEEIVRMLRIVDRKVVDRFARLKELRILLTHRRRLEAEHRAKHQAALAQWTIRHPHHPIRREEFVRSARAGLHAR